MAAIISLFATFFLAYICNCILKRAGFEPEPNEYFGDVIDTDKD